MSSKSRRKTSNSQLQLTNAVQNQHHKLLNECCFEGDRFSRLILSLQREIKLELQSNNILPEKLWFKQHFAVGINEVTRVLERMSPSSDSTFAAVEEGNSLSVVNQGRGCPPCSSFTKLQAVLVAADCSSRWLTKHLPTLAASRNVPLIFIKDNKEGSLRLGEVVKVKTAIALGFKVKGSKINQLLEEVLQQQDKLNVNGSSLVSTESATVSCQ